MKRGMGGKKDHEGPAESRGSPSSYLESRKEGRRANNESKYRQKKRIGGSEF